MVYVGIDLGGSYLKVGLLRNDGGRALSEPFTITSQVEEGPRWLLDALQKHLEPRLSRLPDDQKAVYGFGLGVPAPVNSAIGQITHLANLKNSEWVWFDFNAIGNGFGGYGNTTIVVTNDANAAALAEAKLGAAKEVASSILFTLGTGVGGGAVENGRLVLGQLGRAAEFGHVIVDYAEDAPQCPSCRQLGCLEAYASLSGLVRFAREAEERVGESLGVSRLPDIAAPDLAKIIVGRFHDSDPIAIAAVDRLSEFLARGASTLSVSFDPGAVVIGGGLSALGEKFIEVLKRQFEARYPFGEGGLPTIALATLGNDAGWIGAARACYQKQNPT